MDRMIASIRVMPVIQVLLFFKKGRYLKDACYFTVNMIVMKSNALHSRSIGFFISKFSMRFFQVISAYFQAVQDACTFPLYQNSISYTILIGKGGE